MLRVFELHWWEGWHPQCCTTFSSIAGAQHQPHEEKEGRSHKTPALLQCQDFCLRRLPAQIKEAAQDSTISRKTTSSNNTNGSSTNFADFSAVHTRASCYRGIPALLMSRVLSNTHKRIPMEWIGIPLVLHW